MLAWVHTQSSAIAAIAYQGNSLFVRFKTGREYEYFNVEQRIYAELLDAPSKGRFVNAHIKDHYDYRRVE